MNYYLEDHPNPNTAQYGWPRSRVSGVVGVHTTESGVVFSGPDAGAENTAAFIARRSDYGSYHIMADWDTIVPLTRPTYAAWADTTNNVHALSVSGAMNAARWRDLTPERASQIVRNMGIAAATLVRDAIAHGLMTTPTPAIRISADEAIRGTRAGFYGHGETNPGTRYDPGTNFDWDLFLSTYAAAVGGSITHQSATIQEDELSEAFEKDARGEFDGLRAFQADVRGAIAEINRETDGLEAFIVDVRGDLANKGAQIKALTAANGQLASLLAEKQGLDVEAIRAALDKALAGVTLTLKAGTTE